MHPDNRLLADIERRRLWSHFHKDWLLAIRGLIRPQLPREYAVFVESEVVLVVPAGSEQSGSLSPDMALARAEPHPAPAAQFSAETTAAVLEVDEPFETYSSYSLLIRRAPDQRLVAAIELPSPTNKGVYGMIDKEKYLRKRALYLEAGVNLLEIDALLEGDRMLPSSLESLAPREHTAWSVSHDQGVRHFRGWAWDADEPLPKIAWEVEPHLRLVLDLPLALQQAREFNPWESLARG